MRSTMEQFVGRTSRGSKKIAEQGKVETWIDPGKDNKLLVDTEKEKLITRQLN